MPTIDIYGNRHFNQGSWFLGCWERLEKCGGMW